MAVNLIANDDGSMGLQGRDFDAGGFLPIFIEYVAASVDKVSVTLTRSMRVMGIIGRVTVAGTDAGAVTAAVVKVASGTAITSGTALHSGTMNLKGTANTNITLTLASATDGTRDMVAGDSIAVDFAGVLTAATGSITVWLAPR